VRQREADHEDQEGRQEKGGVRFLHLALYVDTSRRGNASLRAIAGFSVTVAIGMGLLVAGSVAHDSARIALWPLAAAIDYAGPAWLTRERLRGLQRVAVEHFAERYSLFIIICLGESIVAIGVGAGGRRLDAELIAAVSLSLLITMGLRAKIAAAAASMLVFAVGDVPAWATAAALTLVLTALVACEVVTERS
jgi:hypothetical protein